MRELLRMLTRARMRWLGLTAVNAAAFAVIATSIAASLSTVVLDGAHPVVGWLLVLAASTFTCALVVQLRSCPSLVTLAHRLDLRMPEPSAIGAGVELALRPITTYSLVEQAAIDDATDRARTSHARDIVPFRPPRWTWITPFAISLAVAVSMVDQRPSPSSPVDPASPTGNVVAPSGREAAEAVPTSREAVRRVAELLARDEVVQGDAYLRAVAKGFDELAGRLDDAKTTDEALRSELDALLDHLTRAVSTRQDDVGTLLRNLADSGLTEDRAGAIPATQPHDTEPIDQARQHDSVNATAPSSRRVDDLLDELDRRTGDVAVSSSDRVPPIFDSDPQSQDPYGAVFRDDASPTGPSGNVQEGEAAGEAVGAAARSDARSGDAAGDGSHSDDASDSDGGFAEIDVDVSPLDIGGTNRDGGGNRTEGEQLAEARATAHVSRIEASEPSSAMRAPESSVGVEAMGTRYHEIVERYFTPGSVAIAATPP